MEEGQKVIYRYEHSLNSVSKVMIEKEGVFVRWVYKRDPYKKRTDFAMIKINGNKNLSKIHFSQLLPTPPQSK